MITDPPYMIGAISDRRREARRPAAGADMENSASWYAGG